MKYKVAAVLACILTVGFVYAGYQVWQQGSEYWSASSAYSTLNDYVSAGKKEGAGQKKNTAQQETGAAGAVSGGETSRAPEMSKVSYAPERESAVPAPSHTGGAVQDEPRAEIGCDWGADKEATVEHELVEMPESSPQPKEEPEYDYPDIVWPDVNFAQLKQINPEIVAWIYDEGMGLNYPVVQAKDNAKYLDTLFNGKRNKTGCLFLDAGNAGDFSDRHSIIYGHNRKDGSMFGRLNRYKKQSYYQEHPRILLITEHGRYVMEIFSGHVARSDSGAWKIQFSEEEFSQWKNVICERSSIDTGFRPEEGERILTLSTCSYEFAHARYVVHGVLRKARIEE